MKRLSFLLWFMVLVFQSKAQKTLLPTSFWKNQDTIAVFIFLATECPISQQYTASINSLYETYSKKHIQFSCVFGFTRSKFKEEKIQQFQKIYHLNAPVVLDKGFKMAKRMHATVTPEVFLFTKSRGLIYSGAIDNWFYALGKSRFTITEFYLEDAIKAGIENRSVNISETSPVGCFLEYKK